MSLASKVCLGMTAALSLGMFLYVSGRQIKDTERMHAAVLNDKLRQEEKKIYNVFLLEQQAEVTKILKKQQKEDEEISLKLLGNSEQDGI
ncbi:hypothetical protein RUM43_009026 [Polyplax serrata]|uniref:PET117 n=1 Tax=Polyplax serrata TaxID=468196 RepID=A0AAN8PVT5_POLSC